MSSPEVISGQSRHRAAFLSYHRLFAVLKPILALTVLLLVMAASISMGPADIDFSAVWKTLALNCGLSPDVSDISTIHQRIIWELRLPRVLLAALVGAGLAVTGAILQSLTLNSLADPYLLGVSSGAGVGAVVVIVAGYLSIPYLLPLGAFVGAILSFIVVLLLAGRHAGGNASPIILAGVATTNLFSAVTSLLLMWFASANATRGVLFWLLGSLSAARWYEVIICAAVLAVAYIICRWQANALDSMAFGSDSAAALGINIAAVRVLLYFVTAALTATLVAFSGAIGFIGLVMPHMARFFVGHSHHRLLPASAYIGALFTVAADTVARTAFAPQEMPVGVITALIGVPVFMAILYRQFRK
ncbi:iron ABC transporter permease [Cardiobacteriaceae bacterium TAE3-ERU3]|nr:iron ABC transporter permease [Cardiobacteriaceae bacterium TAE3-ERU3]